ncbi:TIGR03943 family protein [bacterium]|nr:TIGR03943 family protein [bacterium]
MWKREPLYRFLVMLIWAIFLFILLLSRRFKLFVNAIYSPLLVVGFIIFLSLIVAGFNKVKAKTADQLTATKFLTYFLMFFPILLVLLVNPTSLPTSAATTRGISTTLLGTDANLLDTLQSQLESQEAFKKFNLKQLLSLANNEPEKIDGLQVVVEGFAFKDETLQAGSIMLVRFLITCCAADATPLGIEVYPDENSNFSPDMWVRVFGTIGFEKGVPVIKQANVTQSPKPSNVYLY